MRSALFLEQASLSFLQVDPPMIRKYAFHLILAGHRFSKCGQVKKTFFFILTCSRWLTSPYSSSGHMLTGAICPRWMSTAKSTGRL